MGKKKKKKKRPEPAVVEVTEPTSGRQPRSAGGGATRAIAIGLFVLGAGVVGYALMSSPSAPSLQSTVRTAPAASPDGKPAPYFDSVEAAKPFPVTLPPSQFENDILKVSYAIAKDIPEVLVQQPCLCGCNLQREGHGSLLDCFIDDHASTWTTCLKEVLLADKMTKAGSNPVEIRDAILRYEFSEVPLSMDYLD